MSSLSNSHLSNSVIYLVPLEMTWFNWWKAFLHYTRRIDVIVRRRCRWLISGNCDIIIGTIYLQSLKSSLMYIWRIYKNDEVILTISFILCHLYFLSFHTSFITNEVEYVHVHYKYKKITTKTSVTEIKLYFMDYSMKLLT